MNDDLFAKPPRRAPTPAGQATLVKRTSCAVCGLRADCLICKECALNTEASIKWLEQLPVSERVTTALALLRTL